MEYTPAPPAVAMQLPPAAVPPPALTNNATLAGVEGQRQQSATVASSSAQHSLDKIKLILGCISAACILLLGVVVACLLWRRRHQNNGHGDGSQRQMILEHTQQTHVNAYCTEGKADVSVSMSAPKVNIRRYLSPLSASHNNRLITLPMTCRSA